MAFGDPPPPTLPPWAKVLWWITNSVIYGAVHDQFDYSAEITPLDPNNPAPATTWRKFYVDCADTVSLDPADTQTFTFDLVNYTNGVVDNTWTAGDYSTVQTALTQFLTDWLPSIPSRFRFDRVQAYIRQFNELSNPKPFADSGPPEWVWTPSLAATGVGHNAPQVCTTITEITPSRKNWGRFYMPTLDAVCFATTGRLSSGIVDGFAGTAHTLYNTLYTAQLIPVVPTTHVQTGWVRTLQSVTAVQVDDVPDVHRSRRFKKTTYRKQLPIP